MIYFGDHTVKWVSIKSALTRVPLCVLGCTCSSAAQRPPSQQSRMNSLQQRRWAMSAHWCLGRTGGRAGIDISSRRRRNFALCIPI